MIPLHCAVLSSDPPAAPQPSPLPHVNAGGLGGHAQQQLRCAVPAQGTLGVRAGTSPSHGDTHPGTATHHRVTTLGVMGLGGIP